MQNFAYYLLIPWVSFSNSIIIIRIISLKLIALELLDPKKGYITFVLGKIIAAYIQGFLCKRLFSTFYINPFFKRLHAYLLCVYHKFNIE